MSRKDVRGFTLIEVVLAIAVGLIIIAGVSVGYTYAKRAAILDNQRKNVAAIKTFLEQAIASQQANPGEGSSNCTGGTGFCPPAITIQQLGQLALRLPSLKNDPYTGTARVDDSGNVVLNCTNGIGPCIGVRLLRWAGTLVASGKMDDLIGSPWTKGSGSGVEYAYTYSYRDTIDIWLSDGSRKHFNGYVIAESDQDGNIIAAEGGDAMLAQLAAQ